MAPKKDKAPPPSSKPAKSGGGKQKKKKWSKGKQKEKVNNMVLFDQATYDKLLSEAPKYKLITPSILSDRLRINGSLARKAIRELMAKGLISGRALMESCCLTLKANSHLVNVRKGGFSNGDSAFLGERIRGSLNNSAWVNQVANSLSVDNKKEMKIKTGASAILTSNNRKEATTVQPRRYQRRKLDPKNVASVILGGGAGTRLFPLTKRAATPAVRTYEFSYASICFSDTLDAEFDANLDLDPLCFDRSARFYVNMSCSSTRLPSTGTLRARIMEMVSILEMALWRYEILKVLAATQTSGEAGNKWFQGTADAVRQFIWVFEDAKNRNIENVIILCGDHLYRMDYMDFLQSHVDNNSDITISCVTMNNSRASDYGLVKIDGRGRIVQFSEKPKGADLKAMQTDTTLLGLSPQEALKFPYIASMGVYIFKTEVLLKLLRWRFPASNDFGSEIIPAAIEEHDVQAYVFKDYWEDIGTIKAFYEANIALTEEVPKFEFYDPKTPFYTSPQYLPPTKIDKCRIKDALISHGCFLRECTIQHSVIGERSRLDTGVELQDTVMLGADYYQTETEIASLLADGKVPIGIGHNTKIRNCIIDKNAKIGKDVIIANTDGVEEADRPDEGFYIRSGITVIVEKATIKNGCEEEGRRSLRNTMQETRTEDLRRLKVVTKETDETVVSKTMLKRSFYCSFNMFLIP
ncbi:hypothetical protein V6N12_006656 [Hibiscus sabdariffa]|uniref:Nucleotidyl transferase domain-containing protein n=1 Tax=Hibiscus sabdariffa TaxID=183260 RepID=A0ABR2EZH4_9ROSI